MKIDQFLDSSGRIIQIPKKQKTKMAVLQYMSEKFELGRDYTEKQVNAICNTWHSFDDCFLLRRELIDNGFLGRELDGSRYWRIKQEILVD